MVHIRATSKRVHNMTGFDRVIAGYQMIASPRNFLAWNMVAWGLLLFMIQSFAFVAYLTHDQLALGTYSGIGALIALCSVVVGFLLFSRPGRTFTGWRLWLPVLAAFLYAVIMAWASLMLGIDPEMARFFQSFAAGALLIAFLLGCFRKRVFQVHR